jgi:hypothetical protein
MLNAVMLRPYKHICQNQMHPRNHSNCPARYLFNHLILQNRSGKTLGAIGFPGKAKS